MYSVSSDATVLASDCNTFQDCEPGQTALFLDGFGALASLADEDFSKELGWTNYTNNTQIDYVETLAVTGNIDFTNFADFVSGPVELGWLYEPNTYGFASINSITNSGDFKLTYEYNAVPEPLTILGAGTAIAFGGAFKRKLAKKNKK